MAILAETTIPGQDAQGWPGLASFQDPSKGADNFAQDPTSGWNIGPPSAFFRPIVKAQPHRSICSWCVPPRVMSDGIEPATHGICAACAEKVRAARTPRPACPNGSAGVAVPRPSSGSGRGILVILAALLLAGPAFAATLTGTEAGPRQPDFTLRAPGETPGPPTLSEPRLAGRLAYYGALQGADIGSRWWAESRGAARSTEMNPLMREPALAFAVKAGATWGLAKLDAKVSRARSPWLRKVAPWVIRAAAFGIAVKGVRSNMDVARGR